MDKYQEHVYKIAHAIVQVVELAYNQRQTITWAEVFQFLKLPPEFWVDDPNLNEPIGITSSADLAILKAMITSKLVVSRNEKE